jgi:hypothetical protein
VTAQLDRSESQIRPGGIVTYSVWVWSTIAADRITTSVSSSGKSVLTPRYTLCPAIHGASCSVGSLPAYQAHELVITDQIGRKAAVGEQIGLSVDVQGVPATPATTLSPAVASISTLVGQASSSPTPINTGTAGDGSGLPPGTIPGLPGTTITPSGLASLFPVVTPSPTPVSSQTPSSKHKVTRATSTASSLPIDPRLIGGQLAGLAVLVAAITMVVARLSLRTPQLAGAAGSGGTAPPKTPEAPAPPAPATTTEAQAAEPEAKPE